MELYSFHLFAGAGGGILADQLLGHRTIGAVEIEEYPRRVLLQRQLDGCLPRFPIWDDVRTFRADNADCAGYIERLRAVRERLVICGGFPCQDISCAGKGAGIDGERSGLWSEMRRIIGEVRPAYALLENSPMLTSRGLGRVLADLAGMGYDARWGVFCGCDAGSETWRKRIFILARRHGIRTSRLVEAKRAGEFRPWRASRETDMRVVSEHPFDARSGWPKPLLRRGHDELAYRVERITAIGNGQDARVASLAWEVLAP